MRTEDADFPAVSTVVLAPGGELDLANAAELEARLAQAHRPGTTVVLDLRDVTFIDSSALAVVLSAHRRLLRTGGALRLVHPADSVLRVLRICGLADRLLGRSTRQPAGSAAPAVDRETVLRAFLAL